MVCLSKGLPEQSVVKMSSELCLSIVKECISNLNPIIEHLCRWILIIHRSQHVHIE